MEEVVECNTSLIFAVRTARSVTRTLTASSRWVSRLCTVLEARPNRHEIGDVEESSQTRISRKSPKYFFYLTVQCRGRQPIYFGIFTLASSKLCH